MTDNSVDILEAVGDDVAVDDHVGMVLVRDIKLVSLCEHHMLPMFGKVHIAYLPNGRTIGPSKLPRVVEVLTRRIRIQERLTRRIAEALDELLHAKGIAVMIEAVHLCMMGDGDRQGPSTITSSFSGVFADDPWAREEFLRSIGRRR